MQSLRVLYPNPTSPELTSRQAIEAVLALCMGFRVVEVILPKGTK